MAVNVIMLSLLAVLLLREQTKEKGHHTAAKWVHAAVLAILVLLHSYSIAQLADAIMHWPGFSTRYAGAVGVLPDGIHLTAVLLHEVLSVLILLAVFLAAVRMRRGVVLLRGLPVALVPVNVLLYYCNFFSVPEVLSWWVFARGVLLMAAVYAILIAVPWLRFMRGYLQPAQAGRA